MNSTQRISVQCLVHHVSDSSYLPFNLPSLPLIFLFFRFAGMLSLPSHFVCPTVSFITLYWQINDNMHLEFGFRAAPVTTAMPTIHFTQLLSALFGSRLVRFRVCSSQPSFTFFRVPFFRFAGMLCFFFFFSFFLRICSLHNFLLQNWKFHASTILVNGNTPP